MPNYEYKCTQCENQYETREGFDAPSRQPCPKCGAIAKRVLFAPPIVFKGSGFYVTDSRKGRRPSWSHAARPELAEPLVEAFATALEALGVRTARGRFGAHMKVELLNDGPVTLIVDSAELDRPRRS